MKAIQLEKPLQFKTVDIPEPAPPGPGEALVRVHRVGICGTDIAGYLGKMPFFSYPRIPGHELGVEVMAVGEGVTQVRPGDRCSVEPYINCQKCSSCLRGHTNCCENHQTLGVHCDGGLRPEFIVPARKLHVSTQLTFEQLALVETLGIGCHAVNRASPRPGESVLVIGAGPIGLSVIEFARIAEANVIVMDLNEQRLEFCRKQMGIRHRLTPQPDGSEVQMMKEWTADKSWPTIVVDATGSNKSMAHAMNYTGFAGKLVFVGITTNEIAVPHPLMHRRELSLLASRNAVASDFKRIIGLIENGSLDTRPWITHHASFAELPEIFPAYVKPETGVIKAMVHID